MLSPKWEAFKWLVKRTKDSIPESVVSKIPSELEHFRWTLKRTNDVPDLIALKKEYIEYSKSIIGKSDPMVTKGGLKLDEVVLAINNKLVEKIEWHIQVCKDLNWRGYLDEFIDEYLDLLP